MDLKRHYNSLWNHSFKKFKRGEFRFDHLIDAAGDTRYGMTLLARPSPEVKGSILDTLGQIKAVAPNQYYYPGTDLHITVLSIISCYPGFSLDDVNLSEYCNIIDSSLKSVTPFQIQFQGITASPSCILIQGFPGNNQLTKLRNVLRKKIKKSDLQHSIDKRYKLQTAHMTAIRFKEKFVDAEDFIETISTLRHRAFGHCLIKELELVGNNWYQHKDKVELVKKFELTA